MVKKQPKYIRELRELKDNIMSQQSDRLEAIDAIKKKLRGRDLAYHEIYNIMDEIAHDRLGNVLTTYFAATSFREGFSPKELYYLTKAMVETGTTLDFPGIVADKHSIGGVAGTRTTLMVVPIVIAAGFTMPKTSSRAITTPAGTADVMELFSRVTFSPEQVKHIVYNVGGCILWGGHLGIAPADDVIIRVEEPLSFESFDKIIVSIMSKKIAMSTNHLIIDLPIGQTMKVIHKKDANLVKKKFEQIANHFGIHIHVDIHHTQEPAGNGVGATLEAIDVLKVLEQKKDRPMELEKRSLRIAAQLLDMCYQTKRKEKDGMTEAKHILTSGKALEIFREIIKAQYGDPTVESTDFKPPKYTHRILAKRSGTIKSVNNFNINAIAKILGAPDNKRAGIMLMKHIGNSVVKREVMLELQTTSPFHLQEALDTLPSFPIYTFK